MARVLIVDDEEDIIDLLKYNLQKDGHEVLTASNGLEALEVASQNKPELIILDVMMPELDGMETCSRLREDPKMNDVIIAFLSARGEDYSQIAGLELGADDYITKPIRPRLLISKVNALLRRKGGVEIDAEGLEMNGLRIDRNRYLVFKGEQEFSLPKKEFELLSLLMSRNGHVLTRENILGSVWGDGVVVGDRTIDVHIRRLREKLGEDKIETVKGVGYKFKTA